MGVEEGLEGEGGEDVAVVEPDVFVGGGEVGFDVFESTGGVEEDWLVDEGDGVVFP